MAEVDPQFKHLHSSLDLHTRLLEVYDWEEEEAVAVFEKGLAAYISLCEYAQYDATIMKDNEEFLKLLRANIAEEMTDAQFEAIHILLDFKLKESYNR